MLKIRESLQVLNWKQIDEKYEEYQDLDSKLRKIDNEISQNEKLQKDIETYKQQISQLQ